MINKSKQTPTSLRALRIGTFPATPFRRCNEGPYTLLPLISLSPNAANTDYSIIYLGTPQATTYQYTLFPACASLQNEALALNNYPWTEI